MSTSDSFAEVDYLLQDRSGGETPRLEVRDEDAYTYVDGLIKDLSSDEDTEYNQPWFPPEMYEEEDRDQLQSQWLQGTPIYFFDGEEEYAWRVQNDENGEGEDILQADLLRSSE